ncbi:MAG: SixA phosphatase family protein [Sphingobacteriales bacterium]
MKKLLLIRHARAVHDNAYNDFERPLKPSGIKDAEFMAEKLHHKKIVPQILVTSPALRTIATADIFSEFLSLTKSKEDKRIYEASRLTLVNIINGLEDKYDFIGLVGHNPAMEDITHYLTGQMPEFPTCGIALIEFEFDEWAAISAGTGKLKWFGQPG